LFGAPVITVVRVADAVATDVFVVSDAVNEHVPGVEVDVTLTVASPADAVIVAEPPPAMLQTLEPDVCEMEMASVEPVPLAIRVPFASVTSTVRVEVLTPSAEIVPGLNEAASFAGAPGAVVVMFWVQPVSEPDASEITAVPVTVVEEYVLDATPLTAVTVAWPVGVTMVGELFVNVMAVELSFATVLPFWSMSVPLTDVVVLPPSAGMLVLVAEHWIALAAPKTVIGAEAVLPPAAAFTAHGWVAEFVAVATKRPCCVTAPQPPLTEKVTVEPVGAPVTVNCCWPPTGRDADAGEMVRAAPAAGVVLTWK
jgi:hypothetical protein